jgi:hypothetical protein
MRASVAGLDLEDPALPAFEPELRRLSDLALGAVGRLCAARGIRADALPEALADPELRTAVRRTCHEAFEGAQQFVGETLAKLEEQVRALEGEVRQLRHARVATAKLERQIETAKNRQLVLRRLMDTVLYHLLQMKPWVARRLMSQRETQRPDPQVVRDALKVAAASNADNRDRFALVADLTSIVDVCDLVELEMVGDTLETRLIELKGGRVNLRLLEAMKDADKSRFDGLLAELGEKGIRQAARILRQQERLLKVRDLLNTDAGTNPLTGMDLKMPPAELEMEGYQAALGELVRRAKESSWAYVTVDSSLRLVGVTSDALDRDGFEAVQHSVYHMGRPGRSCLLKDEARASEELDAVARESTPVDLMRFSMAARWSRPVFLWELNPDSIMDLVFGRVRIFAQFNAEDFRRLIEGAGLKAEWVSRRESGRLRQQRLSVRIPGAPSGVNALRVTGRRERIYLSGFFWRAVGDTARPKDLLHTILLDEGRESEGQAAEPGGA